jgi:hypothetical protein
MIARRLLVVVTLAAGLAGGCGVRSGPAAEWVARVQEQSAGADRARARGDQAAARGLLAGIARAPGPPGVAAADARAVRMDACFRLAMLELEGANPRAAREWAEQGLALGAGRDVFTANLHLAHGKALEGLGVDLEASASYHRALVVSEALLGAALDR